MKKNSQEKAEIKRYYPDINIGLNDILVDERKLSKLTNKAKHAVGKSYLEIVMTDVFSFFNIILFVIAGLMIYGKLYDGLFFLAVIIPNMLIGLYEDIKARILLGKLNLLTQPKATVIRNSTKQVINSNDVVLDDVIYLHGEAQICVDGEIASGEVFVNESALTGESIQILKKKGEKLFAGSYITGGEAIMRADVVGQECFINQLQEKANKFHRSPSQILKSLKLLFRVIGVIVVVTFVGTLAIYASQGRFANLNEFNKTIPSIAGSLVGMIPSGLYLLTSMTLAAAVLTLGKKKAQVQDFYSVEMLARTNVLCVDKTGTITDGTLQVRHITLLDTAFNKQQVEQIIANIVKSTNDNNATANALRKAYGFEQTATASETLPFSSENKYSGASFGSYGTYVIGAAEFIPLVNKEGVVRRTAEYTSQGLRVIVVARVPSGFADRKINGLAEAVALIILDDHIKEDAVETFRWFKENGVDIKVISGDNALTVSKIAEQAGIENANSFISLEGKTNEEVREAAMKYSVFGRVTPEQKEIIIMTLKDYGKTVAMTGDGVNDILALKRADCSIAMASGSDAARNVSHIVLMDSNFSRLPDIVGQGRRVVNNLQRTCSLFLAKTLFAVVAAWTFLIISLASKDTSISYPFLTNHLYLWEILGIGMSAFFLSFQPNQEPLKGKFLSNILRKAIPGGVTVIIAVALCYIAYIVNDSGAFYTSVDSLEIAKNMAVVCLSTLSLVILYKVCDPLNKYRGIVFGSAVASYIGIIALSYYISVTKSVDASILKIDFGSLTGENWFITGLIIFLLAGVYLIVNQIIEIATGEDVQNENK